MAIAISKMHTIDNNANGESNALFESDATRHHFAWLCYEKGPATLLIIRQIFAFALPWNIGNLTRSGRERKSIFYWTDGFSPKSNFFQLPVCVFVNIDDICGKNHYHAIRDKEVCAAAKGNEVRCTGIALPRRYWRKCQYSILKLATPIIDSIGQLPVFLSYRRNYVQMQRIHFTIPHTLRAAFFAFWSLSEYRFVNYVVIN